MYLTMICLEILMVNLEVHGALSVKVLMIGNSVLFHFVNVSRKCLTRVKFCLNLFAVFRQMNQYMSL